jgi:hypothetical protein
VGSCGVSTDLARRPGLDQLLAKLLYRGTWLASFVVALGLALPMAGRSWASSPMMCTRIVTAGIALFIALPVLRVSLMLVVFGRERDFLFGAIAMLVLAIILLGSTCGVEPPRPLARSRSQIRHRAPDFRCKLFGERRDLGAPSQASGRLELRRRCRSR